MTMETVRFFCMSCILFVSCVFIGLGAEEPAIPTIRITNGEWPPYLSPHLKYDGALSRIVSEAFASQGYRVEYGFFPWKRSAYYARTGEWDASIGWAQGRPDFVEDFFFSETILCVPKTLVYLKRTPVSWKKIEDLKGLHIGITDGYTYGKEFDQAASSGLFHAETVTQDIQNLRKILLGRIDAAAMEIDVVLYLMQTALTKDEVEQIGYDESKLLYDAPMCVVFPKKQVKSIEYVKALNRGLALLREQNLIQKYIQELREGRYLMQDSEDTDTPKDTAP